MRRSLALIAGGWASAVLIVILLLVYASVPVFAEPFLSSAAYARGTAQPTIFLVTVDDGAEVESAAANLKHTYTMTVTAYDVATTYRVTIGGANVDTVGSGGTTTTVATAMAVALNASVNANFTPITWTSTGAVVTGTADAAGVGFTPTTAEVSGTGTIGDPVETVKHDEAFLLYDLEGIQFGPHLASVKARNATTTSTAVTLQFDVGVDTPDLIVVPGEGEEAFQ